MEVVTITNKPMSKMKRNESVFPDTILKICEVLNCNIKDVVIMWFWSSEVSYGKL
ncbi:helix-turn-helix domain-containing protein [Mediterraneibacter agrestimuris]|uniref:helix-turn-helix domain-containing protein n=1 Tax=Mediterraneibacter agrestimuris TaxID=2941333 RepID=UPI00240782DE|nr:helix-turn-helix domain-containing protein [Mediterraneibacter agrestimuris]